MKHHYEECVARVTAKHEDANHKGPKEDCVEECKFITAPGLMGILLLMSPVFHLQHCVAQCAAPKLFKLLK